VVLERDECVFCRNYTVLSEDQRFGHMYNIPFLEGEGRIFCGQNGEDAQGWYCPEYGKKVPSYTLMLNSEGPFPYEAEYIFKVKEEKNYGT